MRAQPDPERAGTAPVDARARSLRWARHPFEYAIIRVVPDIERGERINAGIILASRAHRFLGARAELDADRLRALSRGCDPDAIRAHLEMLERIAAGDPEAGPIANLSAPERFHWLVAPASTIIQASRVHTGLTADPAATLQHLFATLVARPEPHLVGRDAGVE